MGEGKEILKFDGGEEIKPLQNVLIQVQKQTSWEIIKPRINQTRKAINALNSIWWHKNITKNSKLYIYQTTIQNILFYGAKV